MRRREGVVALRDGPINPQAPVGGVRPEWFEANGFAGEFKLMRDRRPDSFGDRMKAYEAHETERSFLRGLPVVVRVDGRSFSRFTRGMAKPYDARLGDLMVRVAGKLLEGLAGAKVAYTQSDEITLLLDTYGMPGTSEVLRALSGKDDTASEEAATMMRAFEEGAASRHASTPMFAGRVQKIVSTAAGMATAEFVKGAMVHWPEKCERSPPTFDARAFQVPSREEAANAILWREADAARNAVFASARARFPHRELQGKGVDAMIGLLEEAGVRFGSLPSRFTRGAYLRRVDVDRAGVDGRPTVRRETRVLDMPPLSTLSNRVEVLLEGAAPIPRSRSGDGRRGRPPAVDAEPDPVRRTGSRSRRPGPSSPPA